MILERLPCEAEQGMYAVQRGLFHAVFIRQQLRGDACEQFDIQIPGSGLVGIGGFPFHLHEWRIDSESGEFPFLKQVFDLHGFFTPFDLRVKQQQAVTQGVQMTAVKIHPDFNFMLRGNKLQRFAVLLQVFLRCEDAAGDYLLLRAQQQ